MKISSLNLLNYRCFKTFDIDFDDQLTVLVGVNGSGKTAVLDALSVYLKWLRYISVGHHREINLSSSDIAIGSTPNDVVIKLGIKDSDSVSISSSFRDTTDDYNYYTVVVPSDSDISELMSIRKPVLAAYMAGRFVSESDFTLTQSTNAPDIYLDIENSFNRTLDYASTLVWFDKADADEARDLRDNSNKEKLPELVAVREALLQALLGKYERPRMLGNPSELVVYEKGTERCYKVSQLSDGYRAMLALVMDLARRMAQAAKGQEKNGESLLQRNAIVLIDEIELHLHPSWQQTVLTTLMDIFPNTQFIVTTHSPQVLTSIPPRHIRVLSDGEAHTYGEQTEGAAASRLLERVFGVEQRPLNLRIVDALIEYRKLVYAEKWDTPRATELKAILENHYGNDDPELMKINLHAENSRWVSAQ